MEMQSSPMRIVRSEFMMRSGVMLGSLRTCVTFDFYEILESIMI